MNKWDSRFLDMAKLVAGWSLDPSTKVGSVIADQANRVVSVGFNGFPRGVRDDDRLQDRETKYEMILHAELNAILFAQRSLADCSIYTWPLPPCSRCAALIIQSGIARVVAPFPSDRWKESCDIGRKLLLEAAVPSHWVA